VDRSTQAAPAEPRSVDALPAPIETRVVEDADALAPYLEAWDALAVACGRPFCAPAWMLGWWHEGRTGDARLRVVLVLRGDELVGVGPFFAQVSRLGLAEIRLLAAGFSHRLGPLARRGHEREVAFACAAALAGTRPQPASVVFEGIDAAEPWPELFADGWPGRRRCRLRTDNVMSAPMIDLAGGYQPWFAQRRRRFRKSAGRRARRLAEASVTTRITDDEHAIAALMRLHRDRWDARGGSSVDQTAGRVIARAAAMLSRRDRLAVVLLEGPDGPIASELMVCAGDTAILWGGGFASEWARYAPGTQALLAALAATASGGTAVADLGGGGQPYKDQLADRDEPIAWRTVFPPGPRYPLLLLQLAPKRTVNLLRRQAHRLPAGWRERLKRALRRRR
jgi:CelD/BcsL family acetyltransferase involved in cellulose biosynthesis